ncbi:hypothetical protein FNZ56_04230 [Pseudoluteimonas lycopersici]|uniref:Uncharacterized protein n=1 Tax=Pseudoluteimonas lycopersici TaxID=1324796 RepID=A0A516V3T7_9GAMM|nr:hypothetical protein [Lysobacter lycopersici]QDQ73137.1 hypothetical protein FNZ56_04230 [Lysobacter lycopersici]
MSRILKIGASIFLTIAIMGHANAENRAGRARYVLNARDGWVDFYIVNQSLKDLPFSSRPDRFSLGHEINFVFYADNGLLCKTCRYRPIDDADRMPSVPDISIIPGEMSGFTLSLQELREYYGLGDGCYGVYVEIRQRKHSQLVVVAASNASKICVGNSNKAR